MSKFTSEKEHIAALDAWQTQVQRAYSLSLMKYAQAIARKRIGNQHASQASTAQLTRATEELKLSLDGAEAEKVSP